MKERCVKVDHSALNRWLINYSSSWLSQLTKLNMLLRRGEQIKPIAKSKRMDLNQTVDKFTDSAEFTLSECRNEAAATTFFKAATTFFKQAIDATGFPKKVTIDKNGANPVGLEAINFLLMLDGLISLVEILQVSYVNNLIKSKPHT